MPLPTANTRSGQSQPLTFKVLGRLILTAPQINLLRPGNVLLPESVPDTGLPVTVPQYVGMAVGDMIVLHFFGTYSSLPQRVDAIGAQPFIVARAQVEMNAARTGSVYYEVTRASGGSAVRSPDLGVSISTLKETESFDGRQDYFTGEVHFPYFSIVVGSGYVSYRYIENFPPLTPPCLLFGVAQLPRGNSPAIGVYFKRAVRRLTFHHLNINTAKVTIHSGNTILESRPISSANNTPSVAVFSYAQLISHIIIHHPINSQGINVDNFTMEY